MDKTGLQVKIEQLRSSPYFTSINEQGALVEKQIILLVLCQKKLLGEATSGHWVATATGRQSQPEDPDKLGQFLGSLGLAFSLRSDEYATVATVALNQSLVDELLQTDDSPTVGRLFGYPQTATVAFDNEGLMSIEDQDTLMEQCGLPLFMPQFRLSKAHAQDEVKVLQDWLNTLLTHNFV